MKKINELDIHINRAIITSISVELDDDQPIWVVGGKLVTDQGTPISNFSFSNRSWVAENSKIEIPIEANLTGRDLFQLFTPIILEKFGNMFPALGAGGKR